MNRFIRCSLLAAAATSLMSAQSLDFGFQIKGGITQGNLADDMHSKKMVGLGASWALNLSERNAIIGEVSYLVMPGVDDLRPLPSSVTASSSADRRKNSLEGFGIRGGYRGAMFGTWSWQAGLSVDKLKSRQEVSGQLTVGANTESLAATPESSKANVGAFAGVFTKLGEDFNFQANLLSLGYSQVEWVPSTYSGQPAAASSRNRRGLALEVSLGFRF